ASSALASSSSCIDRRCRPPLFLRIRIRPPPRSTLSPYTTLFRSAPPPAPAAPWWLPLICCAPSAPPACPKSMEHGAVTDESSTRSEEHTSELQSRFDLVCRLLLEKKKGH